MLVQADNRGFRLRSVAVNQVGDVYDVVWVAVRIGNGQADRVPSEPPGDGKGLGVESRH